MSQSLADDTHGIIVRFATSLPDLPLQLADPKHTTVLSLKVLIRKHLSVQLCKGHLNLIYAGKLLHNNDAVWTALRLQHRRRIPPPPPSTKGKEPLKAVHWQPLYLQCSIGEALSPKEIADEIANANAAGHALRNVLPLAQTSTHPQDGRATPLAANARPIDAPAAASPVPQRPLGFDRLLGSGWTAEDVVSLRASFLAHLSYSHTPATMPTGDALRRLEERWLDSTGPGGNSNIATNGGSGSADGIDASALPLNDDDEADALMQFEDDEAGALDDGLWGSMVGFFWPWAAVWRFREQGVWTERQQMMVLLGVTINVLFGFMRMVTSREDAF